ncbi:MAG: response regulator [Minisyncoccia bacterium]
MEKIKILIVDDEYNISIVLKEALLKKFSEKIEVDITEKLPDTFDEAVDFLTHETYQIVLLDGLLSGDNDKSYTRFGYNLIPVIRRSNSLLAKIIMISTDEEMNKKGLELGADCCISKRKLFLYGNKIDYDFINSLDLDFEVKK